MAKVLEVDGNEFDFLIGKSITKVEDDNILYCDDGTKITIETNEGCGGCGNGRSNIDDLKVLEGNSVITNVKCEYENDDGFKLFIYYHDKTLEIEGDDGYGSGYYGGGFYVTIEEVENE